MIQSIQNKNIKQIIKLLKKKKERKDKNLFILEGFRICMETPLSMLKCMYLSSNFFSYKDKLKKLEDKLNAKITYSIYDDYIDIESSHNNIRVYFVKDDIMKKISDTDMPQGILTVASIPKYELNQIIDREDASIIIAEDIRDPGNMGTIIRTIEGAGLSGIILSNNTCDVFSPKVVRSTMGSIFRVPIYIADDLYNVLSILKESNIKIYAAHLLAKTNYFDVDFKDKSAFMIGNEARGLKDLTCKYADKMIKIPMEGSLESLNAAMATSIISYEIYRQRHTKIV